jgi:hypothetical protein
MIKIQLLMIFKNVGMLSPIPETQIFAPKIWKIMFSSNFEVKFWVQPLERINLQ